MDLKDFKIERTLWEKVCKRLFIFLYGFYRPKIGGKRIRVNKPFKYYVNGGLSSGTYVYSQGRTTSLFNIGLFQVTSNGRWERTSRDDFFYMTGKHCDIVYLDEIDDIIK